MLNVCLLKIRAVPISKETRGHKLSRANILPNSSPGTPRENGRSECGAILQLTCDSQACKSTKNAPSISASFWEGFAKLSHKDSSDLEDASGLRGEAFAEGSESMELHQKVG